MNTIGITLKIMTYLLLVSVVNAVQKNIIIVTIVDGKKCFNKKEK